MLEILNSKELFKFLTNLETDQNPLTGLKTVYGGGETNPDGSFALRLQDNKQIKVFYENKTNRSGLDANQLTGHLKRCSVNDILLVTSPRKSDIEIIKLLADKRIVFKTWQEISLFLKTSFKDNLIAQQFVDYGKMSGEFEELGEIYLDDIKVYCEYLKIDFDKKIESIFMTFLHEFDFAKFGLANIETSYENLWGRIGVKFDLITSKNKSFGQFGAIALYYDTYDHEIPFLKNTPDIAFFFDVEPSSKHILQTDKEFRGLLKSLEDEGFENNLDNDKSPNDWRLLYFRKSIADFQIINVQELIVFAESVLTKIIKNNGAQHKYFAEFMLQKDDH